MINNYLISLLMCLGLIAAGLATAGVGVRTGDGRAVVRTISTAGWAAVLLGLVSAILVVINWTYTA